MRYRTRRCGHRPVVSVRPAAIPHSCSMAGATPLHRPSLYARRAPSVGNSDIFRRTDVALGYPSARWHGDGWLRSDSWPGWPSCGADRKQPSGPAHVIAARPDSQCETNNGTGSTFNIVCVVDPTKNSRKTDWPCTPITIRPAPNALARSQEGSRRRVGRNDGGRHCPDLVIGQEFDRPVGVIGGDLVIRGDADHMHLTRTSESRRLKSIECTRRLETPVEGDDHGFARIDGPGHHHDRSRAAAEDAGQRVIRNLLEAELEVGLPTRRMRSKRWASLEIWT